MANKTLKLLMIEARFYPDIADELARGAIAALEAAGAAHERVAVPGVLETPAALAYAVKAGRHDGFVMLGCVIRGETGHYDIVAVQSARAIMDLSVEHRLALGNGILTVENAEQAWARARVDGGDKGGAAARAALAMIEAKAKLENKQEKGA
jgi:6,7-dimethyl-8-ribityllumazine synthase